MWRCLIILQFFTSLLHKYNITREKKATLEKNEKVRLPSQSEAEGLLDNIIFLIEKMGVNDPDVIKILKRIKKFKASLLTFLK